jgi:EAL domain-containing protein (putative c-di-GMP-specific phosphodiesterase class I)
MTEQREVTNHALFSAELRTLKDAGYRIALDDFGEGFANLELLIAIEPDFLKLSSVLCRDLEGDSVRQAMIRSIGALSRSLKLETIAEFIETESEARLIARLGIDYGQGYWFSRPKPLAALVESGRFQTPQDEEEDAAVA